MLFLVVCTGSCEDGPRENSSEKQNGRSAVLMPQEATQTEGLGQIEVAVTRWQVTRTGARQVGYEQSDLLCCQLTTKSHDSTSSSAPKPRRYEALRGGWLVSFESAEAQGCRSLPPIISRMAQLIGPLRGMGHV